MSTSSDLERLTVADLFSSFTLKGVTLRNRIGMSPMTQHACEDRSGKMNDYHVMYLGARAAGGFGLIFPEQVAIVPEGRTTVDCAGIWDDDQVEGHARVTAIIKRQGGVAGIQLGHTGRKGSEVAAHDRIGEYGPGAQFPPDHDRGWQCVGPSNVPYGGDHPFDVHALSVDEIKSLHRSYADAARRAADAGYEWLEMHFAHGYLGAEFFSPLANRRDDQYGGSLENRARFLLEALDAVREVWPERLPLTMRLGSDDFHSQGVQFEESVQAVAWMADHGLDAADMSLGFNTDDMERKPPMNDPGFMLERSSQIKREVGIPTVCSWNLGVPQNANRAIEAGLTDVVLLGRPALSNPHWPLWAARELGHEAPFSMLPDDWRHWLENFRGHAASIGLPPTGAWSPAPEDEIAMLRSA
ncbi:NADH:flavin oxidoreductase/NADH oxidase [Actinomycetospora sp. NBRC 106378]|uniref:oxidoreductase n=1 Tax=Actinomycetospora sp. NBRC 106378 TaxID=3032208 RepID=UPI0024A386BD|nr:NADH:flavin oxidoreductase/NADH oxidase [Actinomycetospora sp. NBRC 106378]GLZ53099.1 NADH:flavin oxidoreductase [Actinomycetospora sp. NBRC 106378]